MFSFGVLSPNGFLRAFTHPNYCLFFGGQAISLVGTWMQRTALIWLIYRLTGSAQILGTIDFASQVSGIILIPLAGALLDRYSRYWTVVGAQVLAMVQALLLAVLVLYGTATIWQVALLNVLLGLINCVDMPARQSFVIEIVDDKKDLANAIALNSAMFNGARIVGPAVAGLAIAALGEGTCFLLNGISYAAVIASLLWMRLPPAPPRTPAQGNIWQGMKIGFRYAYNFLPIRASLMLMVCNALTAMPVMVMLPLFVGPVLGGGPRELGFLMTSFGVGALLGTIYLATRRNVIGLEKVIPLAALLFGGGLIFFVFSTSLYLSLLLALLMGFGMIVQMAATNTVVQTLVDEDKRGRVVSLYTLSFGGFAPVGSLLTGNLAEWFGAPRTFLLAALLFLLGVAVFAYYIPAWRAAAAPVYAKKGICKNACQQDLANQ